MGDATSLVCLRSTGWRNCNCLLGFDRRRDWHDFCLHIFGRDGFNVSPVISLFIKQRRADLNTQYRFPTAGGILSNEIVD